MAKGGSKETKQIVVLDDGTVLRRGEDGAFRPVEADQALAEEVERLMEPAPPKTSINVRIDADVLQWYRDHGKGYQTLINAVLKAYYQLKTRD